LHRGIIMAKSKKPSGKKKGAGKEKDAKKKKK
jgi:hypothetical protein